MRPVSSIASYSRLISSLPRVSRRSISFSTRMSAQKPSWLGAVLTDSSPPPKLYAWNTSNVGIHNERTSAVPDDIDRRIFILGIGNLGRLYATSLAKSPDSPPITLVVHRRELLEQWESGQGIEILRSGVVEANKNFDIEWWTDSQPDNGPVREVLGGGKLNNLIITTKASAALPQVDRLRRYLDHTSTVAFVQNGMSKLWPPHGLTYTSHRYTAQDAPNFLACVTTHGVTSQGPFKSFHASLADAVIGPVLPNLSPKNTGDYLVKQIIDAPHLDARFVPRSELWILQLEKLVVNAILNPLTGILNCKNGVLFTDPDGTTAKIISQLLKEASQVLQLLVSHESSAGIIGNTSGSQGSGPAIDTSPQALHERFSYPRLRELVYRVGHKVGENTSSMLQDIRAGRSTEVRDFNGWLIETAAYLDPSLDVTGHRVLVGLVEAGRTLHVDQLATHFDTEV